MDRMIYLAMSGAKHVMHRQESVANNLANANTPGYRAETLAFRGVPTDRDARVYAIESSVGADLAAGPVQQTGRALDVAPQGGAWLAVQATDGSEAYTRNGNLQVGPNGTLQTAGGAQVLGDGGPIAVPDGAALSISADGTISAAQPGQSRATVALGRLKLVTPAERELSRGDDGLFRAAGGEALAADPAARVVSGALEGSNVNVVDAMVGMISAARQFEMHMKLLQTAQEDARAASQLLNVGG
ncbi:MAG: flagellar basal-body rod protein FlgF [Betaproteobacteria bacterium]|nr:flagellar basal-body rod protein FlgF [Betaproteobacteria bacterium]